MGLEGAIPKWASEPCIRGINKAGRGPVLGPMVYGCLYCALSYQKTLSSLNFADSKTLKEEKRKELFENLKADECIAWAVDVIDPRELLAKMLKKNKINLNKMSHDSAIGLVRRVLNMGVLLIEVYVDTVGDAEKYRIKLSERFPAVKFVVTKKANSLYPVVSGASIVAKDWVLDETVENMHRDFGSGYPEVFGFPTLVRFNWGTCTPYYKDMVEVLWESDKADEDGSANKTGKRQLKLSSVGFTGLKRKSEEIESTAMAFNGKYELIVHYRKTVNSIGNIDLDRYCFLELMDDVCQVSLSHLSSSIGLAIDAYCDVPGSNEKMAVDGTAVPSSPFVITCSLNYEDKDFNVEMLEESDTDVLFGLSSDDEELNDQIGEYAADKTNKGFMGGVNLEQHSGDGLSSYGSTNEAGYKSSNDDTTVAESNTKFKGFDDSAYGKEYHAKVGENIVLKEGLLFKNVNKFREVLQDFKIQEGCKIVRLKNEKSQVTCVCVVPSCKWRVHGYSLPDGVTFLIKTYGKDHNCLYKAKMRALDEIEGLHEESYRMLPMYANEIMKTNQGSLVKIDVDRPNLQVNPTFKRTLIAFEAIKNGFNEGCKPFIGIDGCHLKGPYSGVLLAAVALDGNNGLFPIVIGVVESEGRESWGFFLKHLSTIIGGNTYVKPWTFMSDQQKVNVLLLNF
ncbi:hypothetical protein F0562_025685 [Nyssa sinensis]|uniref:Ribonuclease n=1 Tax=Nyssa sinensis TaxID=561372 RepID=A0A5J5B6Z4_9ASTE|nr:hypothetical protein F0562_025685 [Nyssa sinensis]